jgi:hypothetical protein
VQDVPLQVATEEPEAVPWRIEPFSAVIDAVMRTKPDTAVAGRPVVLAVDGRSNRGKTTLAARIADAVHGAAVVHTDDIAWKHGTYPVHLTDDGVCDQAVLAATGDVTVPAGAADGQRPAGDERCDG